MNSFKRMCYLHMQNLTNFPYIEEDFDAITNYELLCKVVEYLNNVIKNENEQNDAINNLTTAFNELKSYVDNFFDNLDVQEEINNKLDAMAADGTLDQIIEQYLNSSAIWGFDTVADMKSATNLINGSYARTLGYYTKNDGGGSLYKIRNITNDDVVDEMFIIEINDAGNNLIAELIYGDNINILSLGAKKDKTQDISNIVNLVIFKNINVYIPKGEYLISNSIIINKDYYNMLCNGKLYLDNITCISLEASLCEIKLNDEIIGNNNGTAIKVGKSEMVTHNNIYIKKITNCENGILISPDNGYGVQYCKFNFSSIKAVNCIKFNPTNLGVNWINENTFTGGRLVGTNGIITVKGSEQTDRFNGNKFLNIGFEGVNNGIVLNFAKNNIFDKMRMDEITENFNYFISCDNTSEQNQFFIDNGMSVTYINDNSNATVPNSYNAPFFATSPTGTWFANKIYIRNNKIYVPKENYFNILNLSYSAYNKSDPVSTNSNVYTEDLYITAGGDNAENTHDVIIPKEILGKNGVGITSFYLYIAYKSNSATLNIKDSDNNILIDNSKFSGSISSKNYRIYKSGYPNTWAIEEITLL